MSSRPERAPGERARVTVRVHRSEDDRRATLADDARAGLASRPRDLPPKHFYDDRGSALFDEITRLPEYYPTRTERAILEAHADEVAVAAGASTIVELGSGTSEKTRLLLDAVHRAGTLRTFVPFDVSEATLRAAATTIAREHPGLAVHAVVGDFERDLRHIPDSGPRMVALLGGTIGNLAPSPRARFLAELAAELVPGDSLLLGVDLVKAPARLVAAYDDAAGVTAEFNRNVLHVLNRELGADFAPERFEHVARWDAAQEWIEMRLRATTAQVVKLPAIDLVVELDAGEEVRTEISAKFRRAGVDAELTAAGLAPTQWWSDPAGDFALVLAHRT